MTKHILLVGLRETVIDHARHELEGADIQLFEGTGIEDVRSVFAQANNEKVSILSLKFFLTTLVDRNDNIRFSLHFENGNTYM